MSKESIKDIIEEIRSRSTFSAIVADDFAPDGKWASRIAEYLGKR